MQTDITTGGSSRSKLPVYPTLSRAPAAAQCSSRHPGCLFEWRSLTVALLDKLAAIVRQKLGMDAQSLPLAKILEGGTWATGRILARERRADGSPPIKIISDGTVF